MSSLAKKVSEVPDAYEHSERSTAILLKETGYLEQPQTLTVADVQNALAEDPDLAELWFERGHDQRLSGGWGIDCEGDCYRVQSFSTGQHLIEQDRLHACAQFIVRYVGFIAEVVRRHQH